MGAMLRFKKETGKEITELSDSLTELCAYLYCCVASACAADKVPFSMDLMEFADALSPEDLNAWAESVAANTNTENAAGEEKKS